MANTCLIVLAIGVSTLASAADRRAAVRAENASIEPAVVGYFQSADGVIAVEGVSGAAHARALAPIDADRVLMPPGQKYEWLERDGRVYVSLLPQGQPMAVEGAWPGAGIVSFSPNGTAAALYRATGGIQVVGGLPGAAHVVREFASPAPDIAKIAISDDGAALLVGSAAGVFDGEGRLTMAGPAGAIGFVSQKHDAIVATGDRIFLLNDGGGARWLADADSPVAVAASDDARSAVVLYSGGKEALQVDLETGVATHMQLGTAATDIQRGRDGALIFIPRQGASPWLLDTRSGALSFAPELR